MNLWVAALVGTDGTIGMSNVVKAATAEDARDMFANKLPRPSRKCGAYVAVWRLGNFPNQWLISDTPTGRVVRSLGRCTVQVLA